MVKRKIMSKLLLKRKMKNKAKTVRDIIKSIINTWDPIGLLEIGCPDSEYDIEIDSIWGYIMKNLNIINSDVLGKYIFNIFFINFEDTEISKYFNECKEIAAKLIEKVEDVK